MGFIKPFLVMAVLSATKKLEFEGVDRLHRGVPILQVVARTPDMNFWDNKPDQPICFAYTPSLERREEGVEQIYKLLC